MNSTKKNHGEIERQNKLLEKEGHTVINEGKRAFIKDFEKHVIKTEYSRILYDVYGRRE